MVGLHIFRNCVTVVGPADGITTADRQIKSQIAGTMKDPHT